MSIFGVFEKLLAFLTFFPPLYMAYRYVRWYMRTDHIPVTEEATAD